MCVSGRLNAFPKVYQSKNQAEEDVLVSWSKLLTIRDHESEEASYTGLKG